MRAYLIKCIYVKFRRPEIELKTLHPYGFCASTGLVLWELMYIPRILEPIILFEF